MLLSAENYVYDTMFKRVRQICSYELLEQNFKVFESIYNSIYNHYSVCSLLNKMVTYDKETCIHCIDTSIYCILMGMSMGCNYEELYNVALAGVLHDIGKLRVPVSVLNYAGKIDKSIIIRHSEYGYEICSTLDIPECVKIAILQHHEKLDGSGYPNGLVGNNIICMARVVSIADIYSAITSRRTYHEPMSKSEALRTLHNMRGLDKDLVKLMNQVVWRMC